MSTPARAGARWEHFEHKADVGVRGLALSMDEAFAQAAVAMTAVITDPELVQPKEAVFLRCQSSDREMLLTEWLNALLFEMATRRMLFSRFDVRIDRDVLEATAWGEPVDERRHQPAVEVKGATFTELEVAQLADGSWLGQCVVDV